MTLKEYRKQIRHVWLPLVGRGQFSAPEYVYTQELFDSEIPVELVLKAIQNCADRARAAGTVIYSLGVISGDIEALQKKRSDSQVGASPIPAEDWREAWIKDLQTFLDDEADHFFKDEESNHHIKTLYQTLLSDLPSLDKSQAQDRMREIGGEMQRLMGGTK